jgi:hypothetical protein
VFQVIGFIDHLQVVQQTTITLSLFLHFTVHCYTHKCPQSISVYTIRFLATEFNSGTTAVSLNYALQISRCCSTYKVLSSQPDCQLNSFPSLLNHIRLLSQKTPSILFLESEFLVTWCGMRLCPIGTLAIVLAPDDR